MNNQDHYRIVPIELSITLLSFIIGVGILTIPRSLAQELESPDGWISLALSGVIVMIFCYLYTRLQRNFVGMNILEYLKQGSIGKWGAKILAILFIIYFITLCSFEARILTVVVKMYLLDQTPSEVVAGCILLLTTYAVHKGVQGVIHLNLIFMPIIMLVIMGVLSFNIPEFDYDALRPVFSEGVSPVLLTLKNTLLSFLGIESIFFFMAYMKKSDLRSLPLNISLGIITILYILVTTFAYSIFSLDATKFITFPTIELAKEIEVPGAFFERFESLMMTVWIMTIFNTMTMCHFFAYSIFKKEFLPAKKNEFKKTKAFLPSIIQLLVFIITFIPNSLVESFTFSDWIGWLGALLFVSSILFGYLSLWIRKHKSKRKKRGLEG